MTAGNICVAYSLDTVHQEMDSWLICSHGIYNSVWLPVIGEQLIMEKKPAGISTR